MAASTLKKKITDMAWATSSSSALITGAVAAMAEPPQMEEPTPTRVEMLDGICMSLWSTKAITREVVMVHTMMGRDCLPVSSTTFKFMPKPRRMTAHCSIFFGGEFDTVLQPVFSFHEYGYDHAGKDGDDSAANDGEHFPQKPGRDSQQQAECQSFPFLL